MKVGLNQISGAVTIIGSLLFLVAAFLPISVRVFPEPSAVKRLSAINASPGQWRAAQLLFALGTVVTVMGIALYSYHVRQEPFGRIIWSSVALLTLGAMPWLWHLYARALDPASFTDGLFPRWPYLFYFVVTEVGLAILGVGLLDAPLQGWVGWIVILSAGLLVILTLIFRDIAPFAFYIVTLFAGVMLFR